MDILSQENIFTLIHFTLKNRNVMKNYFIGLAN
jgi:hypothetical protein